MNTVKSSVELHPIILTVLILIVGFLSNPLRAEYSDDDALEEAPISGNKDLQDFGPRKGAKRVAPKRSVASEYSGPEGDRPSIDDEIERQETETPPRKKRKTRYFVEDTQKIDAGVFHVAFAASGNFYIEPVVVNLAPTGDFFTDFGFGVGVFFDYDYTDTNLGLRGFSGYKYILNSVHVFAFDAIARILFPFSNKVKFSLGLGASAAVWFRKAAPTVTTEEVIFLPSFIISAGFDFNPFLTELRWLINRFGENTTITGIELHLGIRL